MCYKYNPYGNQTCFSWDHPIVRAILQNCPSHLTIYKSDLYPCSLYHLCFLLPSASRITCAGLNGVSAYIMAKEVILIEAGATFSHLHFSQSPSVDDFCRGVGI